MENYTQAIESFGDLELIVPADMYASSGPWDESAEWYGPMVADLNQEIDVSLLRRELDEYGLDSERYADDDDALWQYVAWIIAGDRFERANL
jgi:hypothetical protein